MVGLAFILIAVAAVTITVILWVSGINYMKENHPEYKGWDLYNKEEENEQD